MEERISAPNTGEDVGTKHQRHNQEDPIHSNPFRSLQYASTLPSSPFAFPYCFPRDASPPPLLTSTPLKSKQSTKITQLTKQVLVVTAPVNGHSYKSLISSNVVAQGHAELRSGGSIFSGAILSCWACEHRTMFLFNFGVLVFFVLRSAILFLWKGDCS